MDALKITWLRRLIVSESSGWAYLLRQILGIDRLLYIEGGSIDLFVQKHLFHYNRFLVDIFN